MFFHCYFDKNELCWFSFCSSEIQEIHNKIRIQVRKNRVKETELKKLERKIALLIANKTSIQVYIDKKFSL
jgi:hypothetical protein